MKKGYSRVQIRRDLSRRFYTRDVAGRVSPNVTENLKQLSAKAIDGSIRKKMLIKKVEIIERPAARLRISGYIDFYVRQVKLEEALLEGLVQTNQRIDYNIENCGVADTHRPQRPFRKRDDDTRDDK